MNNFYFKGLYKTTCYKTKSNLSQVFFSLTADECFSLFPYQNVFRHRAPHPPFQKVSTKSWSAPPSSKKASLLPTLSTLSLPYTKPSKTDSSQMKIQTEKRNKVGKNYLHQSQIRFFARINHKPNTLQKHSFTDVLQNTRS